LITALVAAVVVLAGSVGYAATASRSGSPPFGGSMMGAGVAPDAGTGGSTRSWSMMGAGMGSVWLSGDGTRVTSITAARARASQAAALAGLHPGEVIWFDNGFYVELKDSDGDAATEVIVNPTDGTVTTEPGPAMMWNTRFGMHDRFAAQGPATVSQDQAQAIAQVWLDTNQPGVKVMSVDSYPGYYTVDVGRSGTITGMLSVNATSGQVWFHTWHGRFVAREDA
jgi:hypothetical protein